MNVKIGFIGAGNMTTAILPALIKNEQKDSKSVYIYDLDLCKTDKLQKEFGVSVAKDLPELTELCDIIVLAVKPYSLEKLVIGLVPLLDKQLIISILASVSLESLQSYLVKDVTIVRTMPNIGAMIGESITAYAINKDQDDRVLAFLNSFGKSVLVDESKFDEFTALCGSSPAYYFKIMESMINYGLDNGFAYEDAVNMVTQSMIASAKILQSSELTPKELMNRVATKGGITEVGLKVLEELDINKTITKTLIETAKRSRDNK